MFKVHSENLAHCCTLVIQISYPFLAEENEASTNTAVMGLLVVWGLELLSPIIQYWLSWKVSEVAEGLNQMKSFYVWRAKMFGEKPEEEPSLTFSFSLFRISTRLGDLKPRRILPLNKESRKLTRFLALRL